MGSVGKRDTPEDDVAEDAPRKVKLLAESFKPLSSVTGSGSEPVLLLVRSRHGAPDWRGLSDIVRQYPGEAPVKFVQRLGYTSVRVRQAGRIGGSSGPIEDRKSVV